MKSHAGARKRFKKLKSGLVKYAQANRRHLLTRKTKKRKRQLRQGAYIDNSFMPHMRVLLPY